MKRESILFGFCIFLGSFLLFQVQPIIGKYILPWFGGTSSVWTTLLLFFQVVLLLGYLYVFLLSRLSFTRQTIIHSIVVLTIIGIVGFLFFAWPTPIMPDIKWKLNNSFSPVVQVLAILLLSVGLPYFLLSTTSILLQKWISKTKNGQSPYHLYALSNTASLLGVIGYPILIEPFLPLKAQGIWWALGFILYGIVLFICCLITLLYRDFNTKTSARAVVKDNKITISKNLLWIGLPALATLMLLSISNLLTQSIAPVPFLWLLPLCIYLVSFILSFGKSKWYLPTIYAYILLFLSPIGILFMLIPLPSFLGGILLYTGILFCCCMLCHGEVYRLKPSPNRLDKFYLFIAIGSAISGVFVGIIAPTFFNGLWEVYIGFYLSIIVAFAVLIYYKNSFIHTHMRTFFSSQKEAMIMVSIMTGAVILAICIFVWYPFGNRSIKLSRNFYGVLRVKKQTTQGITISHLLHGNVIHGTQINSKTLRRQPLTYYSKKSGVGLALTNYTNPRKNIRVGLVGLGVGTLASYGKKGDVFTFYEINPQVIDIAYTNFTYLTDSPATIQIVLGDARLSLEKEIKNKTEKKYDVLVIDAFSDDSIPIHLLTKEAVDIYLQRIKNPDGILAFHITNTHLDLKPVIIQLAQHFDLRYEFIHSQSDGLSQEAEWAVLSHNQQFFKIPTITHAKEKNITYKKMALWTDDYSNLIQILKTR